jgi:hypothetical protein
MDLLVSSAWILSVSAKKLSNLCHTLENQWFACKGKIDQNISLEVLANFNRTTWLRMVKQQYTPILHILVSRQLVAAGDGR